MANQIIFGANITPPGASMEVTINAGTTFAALAFATVGSNQQGTLSNVPAATYAAGQLGLGAVGYPATRLYNTAPVTVTGAAPVQTLTANSSTPS